MVNLFTIFSWTANTAPPLNITKEDLRWVMGQITAGQAAGENCDWRRDCLMEHVRLYSNYRTWTENMWRWGIIHLGPALSSQDRIIPMAYQDWSGQEITRLRSVTLKLEKVPLPRPDPAGSVDPSPPGDPPPPDDSSRPDDSSPPDAVAVEASRRGVGREGPRQRNPREFAWSRPLHPFSGRRRSARRSSGGTTSSSTVDDFRSRISSQGANVKQFKLFTSCSGLEFSRTGASLQRRVGRVPPVPAAGVARSLPGPGPMTRLPGRITPRRRLSFLETDNKEEGGGGAGEQHPAAADVVPEVQRFESEPAPGEADVVDGPLPLSEVGDKEGDDPDPPPPYAASAGGGSNGGSIASPVDEVSEGITEMQGRLSALSPATPSFKLVKLRPLGFSPAPAVDLPLSQEKRLGAVRKRRAQLPSVHFSSPPEASFSSSWERSSRRSPASSGATLSSVQWYDLKVDDRWRRTAERELAKCACSHPALLSNLETLAAIVASSRVSDNQAANYAAAWYAHLVLLQTGKERSSSLMDSRRIDISPAVVQAYNVLKSEITNFMRQTLDKTICPGNDFRPTLNFMQTEQGEMCRALNRSALEREHLRITYKVDLMEESMAIASAQLHRVANEAEWGSGLQEHQILQSVSGLQIIHHLCKHHPFKMKGLVDHYVRYSLGVAESEDLIAESIERAVFVSNPLEESFVSEDDTTSIRAVDGRKSAVDYYHHRRDDFIFSLAGFGAILVTSMDGVRGMLEKAYQQMRELDTKLQLLGASENTLLNMREEISQTR